MLLAKSSVHRTKLRGTDVVAQNGFHDVDYGVPYRRVRCRPETSSGQDVGYCHLIPFRSTQTPSHPSQTR